MTIKNNDGKITYECGCWEDNVAFTAGFCQYHEDMAAAEELEWEGLVDLDGNPAAEEMIAEIDMIHAMEMDKEE